MVTSMAKGRVKIWYYSNVVKSQKISQIGASDWINLLTFTNTAIEILLVVAHPCHALTVLQAGQKRIEPTPGGAVVIVAWRPCYAVRDVPEGGSYRKEAARRPDGGAGGEDAGDAGGWAAAAGGGMAQRGIKDC